MSNNVETAFHFISKEIRIQIDEQRTVIRHQRPEKIYYKIHNQAASIKMQLVKICILIVYLWNFHLAFGIYLFYQLCMGKVPFETSILAACFLVETQNSNFLG